MVHFMGSDAHNTKKRNFCLKDAIAICEKLIGHKAEKLVYEKPKKLIKGEKIIPLEITDMIIENFFQRILNKLR